ncbi:hypothetical protein BTVI_24218 [Pitangus sulphuratus]|nr:hypothetical protein BTVI_24218 [Pitangus sulphuratus]
MTKKDQTKFENLNTHFGEQQIFFSRVSRSASIETNSIEPSHASRCVKLLEEDWHVEGYRLFRSYLFQTEMDCDVVANPTAKIRVIYLKLSVVKVKLATDLVGFGPDSLESTQQSSNFASL